MKTPVNSLTIANYFIRRSMDEDVEMTPMKLIKLVYISHGWCLGLTDDPLLPESIEAWQYGPVVPTVYNEFKNYGRSSIKEMVFDNNTNSYPLPQDAELNEFLGRIWNVYGHHDGLKLSALTHQKGTPWYITWNDQDGKKQRAVIIKNDLIKQHYKEKIAAQ